jgi:putative endonuclease
MEQERQERERVAVAKAEHPRDQRRVGLGRGGESLAAAWLEARGMRVIARNWRCPYGEADLITEVEDTLVFVEVKTRRGERHGIPEEAITPAKQRHLIAVAQAFLAEHGREEQPYRIDVLAIQLSPHGTLIEIRHHPNAVGEDGQADSGRKHFTR